jgi:hypothetical protein
VKSGTRQTGRTYFQLLGARQLVATERESGLSQPSGDSDFTGRSKGHPAKDFAKEAESRNASRTDDKDRFEFSALGGRLFSFKGEGDWLDRWGGPLVSLVCVAIVALGIYVIYVKVGQ